MTFKLTKSQFVALNQILKDVSSIAFKGQHISKQLLLLIIDGVYRKFHARELDKKPTVSIKITDVEAIAWYLLFSNHTYDVISFEGNLLNQLNYQIHQSLS